MSYSVKAFRIVAKPAFELQGNSLLQGVRFSVQTASLVKVAYRRQDDLFDCDDSMPLVWKENFGTAVCVLSIKFSDAQKRPDRVLVSPCHLVSVSETSGRNHAHNWTPAGEGEGA